MKRDMDLIRLMLLHFEGVEEVDLSGHSEDVQTLHASLLVEAGFVHGEVIIGSDGDPAGVIVNRLTWEGYEFLDEIRDDRIWKKAVTSVGTKVGSASMTVLQQLVQSILKSELGL